MPPALPYQPIDCGFYDRIEQAAVRGIASTVVYLAPDGSRAEAHGRVADVFSRDGAEYLRLDGGPDIRLDRVLALDGAPRPGAPSCSRPPGEI